MILLITEVKLKVLFLWFGFLRYYKIGAAREMGGSKKVFEKYRRKTHGTISEGVTQNCYILENVFSQVDPNALI